MNAFELVEPSSLDEALGFLDPDDPAVRPIAGGTALMLVTLLTPGWCASWAGVWPTMTSNELGEGSAAPPIVPT